MELCHARLDGLETLCTTRRHVTSSVVRSLHFSTECNLFCVECQLSGQTTCNVSVISFVSIN